MLKRITIICIIFILQPFLAMADIHLYGPCVKSYEFTDDKYEGIVLPPINNICYQRCQSECKAFSRTLINPDDVNDKIELNDDVINDCIPQCQKGILYSSIIQVDIDKDKIPIYEGPVSIGVACDTEGDDNDITEDTTTDVAKTDTPVVKVALDLTDNAYQTIFTVNGGEKFEISLMTHPEAQSKIYMCGSKRIKMQPFFPNTLDAKQLMITDWYNPTTPPVSWPDHSLNQCLTRFSTNQWNSISDADVWNTTRRADSGICGWHVKNPFFTDTGINFSDGDELVISWTGNYSFQTYSGFIKDDTGNAVQDTGMLDQTALLQCINNHNIIPQARKLCQDTLANISSLLIKSPNGSDTQLIGEMARPKKDIGALMQTSALSCVNTATSSDTDSCEADGQMYAINGLTARVIDLGVKTILNPGCDPTSESSYNNPNCISIQDYGSRQYVFSGIVKDFSKTKTPLLIKHFPNLPTKDMKILLKDYPDIAQNGTSDAGSGKQMTDAEQNQAGLNLLNKALQAFRSVYTKVIVIYKCSFVTERVRNLQNTFTADEMNTLIKIIQNLASADSSINSQSQLIKTMLDVVSHNSQAYVCGKEVIAMIGALTSASIVATKDPSKMGLIIKNVATSTSTDNVDDIKQNVIDTGYGSAIGGYTVDITWNGCPYTHGERVQYAIQPIDISLKTPVKTKDLKWNDLDLKVFQDGVWMIPPNTSGQLYLRIKEMSADEIPISTSTVASELYTDYANYGGQYYILLKQIKENKMVVLDGVFIKLVKYIDNVLFGKDYKIDGEYNTGVIYSIYNGIVHQAKFDKIISTLILLYIIFSALSFMLGIAQINREELIYRLIKLGFVLTVISPNSWAFFGGYIVPLVHDGIMDLAKAMVPIEVINDSNMTLEEFQSGKYTPFALLDGPLNSIFSTAIWKKIAALIFSNLFGMITVAILLLGSALYLLTIIRVVLTYIYSMIIMSLLLVMAPIFIPCILFAQTRDMFKEWAMNMISAVLQTVFAFTSIFLFNLILYMLLQISFGFTACPGCFLSITIFKDICIIPDYQMLYTKHFPDSDNSNISFFFLGNIFGSSLAFLIVAHMSYIFMNMIGKLVHALLGLRPDIGDSAAGLSGKAINTGAQTGRFATSYITSKVFGGKKKEGEKEDVARDDKKNDQNKPEQKKNSKTIAR